MKRLISFLCLATPLIADPLVEFKVAYFRYNDRRLRKVYGDGVGDPQLTFTYSIWNRFNCYLGVESIHDKSKDRRRPRKLELTMYPISLGVQYLGPISSKVDWYATVGPQFIFYHQRSHRTTIANRLDKNGFGGFANLGLLFHIYKHLTFDLFGQYSYRVVHYQKIEIDSIFLEMFPSRKVQIGGVSAGAGIGYKF